MTNFEKFTETPEALGALLASLTVADGPWDAEFHKVFCDGCPAENCDAENCPHNAERNNPLWWLMQTAEGEPVARRPVWRGGRLGLEPGVIIPLENPLRVHIRAARRETPLGAVMAGEAMDAAWRAVEAVKKEHPDAEISVEMDV